MPFFSVVIAVRNRSEHLRQALQSLSQQTYQDWECIVVDDHSNDDIAVIVADQNDPRFRYVLNEGKPGISSSRNLGNKTATGEWIAVCDSDDINLPRRLEVTARNIASNPVPEIWYSEMYTFTDLSNPIKLYREAKPYVREDIYLKNFIPHPTACYRRETVLPYGYDESLSSSVDYDLWLAFSDSELPFGYIEEPLVLYRRHPDQVSNRKAEEQRQTAEQVRLKHLEIFKRQNTGK